MSAAPSSLIAWLSETALAHQMCVDPSSISANFGVGESQYKLTFDIANITHGAGTKTTAVGCLPDFIADVLGYSVSYGAGNGINRSLPAQHPECSWLYASKVDLLQGVGPTGSYAGIGGGLLGQWRAYRMAVTFESPPYFITSNAAVSANTAACKEYQRYTYMEGDPASEFLTRQGGAFQWPAGAPTGVANTPVQGSMAASVTQRISKTKLKIVWVNVPDEGLWGTGGFSETPYSAAIESRVGTVNSTSFLNRPRGTMLLTGWKPTSRTMPVSQQRIGGDFPRAWDVELYFSYFQQAGMILGVPGVVGHNLAPAPAPAPNGGLWWRVYLKGTAANPGADTSQYWRYQESDHNQLFTMNA